MSTSKAITWLHLSDLHFRESRDYANVILKALLRDLKGRQEIAPQLKQLDFIAITGDIASTSRPEEYALATEFLDNLLHATGVPRSRLFVVPGNHDVDRSVIPLLGSDPISRLTIRDDANALLASDANRSIVLRRFHNYKDFVNRYFGQEIRFDDNNYYYTKTFEVAGKRLAIMGLNSAWSSASDDDYTRLLLGEPQVRAALGAAKNADLRIAILHHPFNWLNESDRAAVAPLLLRSCHFVLQGHLHESSLLQLQSADMGALVIPAGACYASRQYPNSYNFVHLDFATSTGSIYLRRYSDRQGGFWVNDSLSFLDAPGGMLNFNLPIPLRRKSVRDIVPPRETGIRTELRPRIFLSYAREDVAKVEELYQRLSDAGLRPWMDEKDVLPGEKWESSIRRAIRNSDFFLACLSRNSVNRRGWIQMEIKEAVVIWRKKLESDIYMIPVRLEECEVPDGLRHFQWVDVFEEDGWTRLVKAIQVGMQRRGIEGKAIQQVARAESPRGQIPLGFRLRQTLRGQSGTITRIAWSPDGHTLASPSLDKSIWLWDIQTGISRLELKGHTTEIFSIAWSPDAKIIASGAESEPIRIWDTESGIEKRTLSGHSGRIECLAWSHDGRFLASASADTTIRIWSMPEGKAQRILIGHKEWINAVAWSPDDSLLASGAEDNTVRIWDAKSGELVRTMHGHTDWISDIAWSADGRAVASTGHDMTIRLWNSSTGAMERTLLGHTDRIRSISFSSEGEFLASKSEDDTVRLWRCDTWETVAILPESTGRDFNPTPSIAFHPGDLILATLGEKDTIIRIWELDREVLLGGKTDISSLDQLNAKVVLLGETGVGKTGLGIRIAENKFYPTESSHGAQFWQVPVSSERIRKLPDLQNVQVELTLWDLAGQADYHLIHQLFLDDTDAALLLFDCSNPADPFRGVPYWAKVIEKQAPSVALKLLISARCDVCPVTVGQHAINRFLSQYALHDHLPTSAKTGDGVDELVDRVIEGIPWNKLPRTSTPQLFKAVRDFLLERKELGSTLIALSGIWSEVRQRYTKQEATEAEVDAVIDLLQSQGLIYRLNPTPRESWILLRPEKINQYASSIIQAAREHPRGIGAVPEHEVIRANIPFDKFERLGPFEERVVLESTIELFIRHNLCFREMGMLVFPSQVNVLPPPKEDETHPRSEVTYEFSGSVEAIYASLVVRLSNTKYFQWENRWKYAAEFSRNSFHLGFAMRQVEEGTSHIEIYFYPGVSNFDRVTFISFVTDHLQAKGIGIREHIRLFCPKCDREIENRDAIEARVRAGKLDILCQYDDTPVIIPRSVEELYRSDPSYQETKRQLIQAVEERTEQVAEAFKSDQRQYTQDEENLIHILHLSDIHLDAGSDPIQHFNRLEADLKRELGINRLEYLVLSGDISHYSTPDEYAIAFDLIDRLVKRFGLDTSRVIIVPGNHDLNWDLSKKAYDFVYQDKLPSPLPEGRYIPAGDAGALLRNEELYKQRFTNFNTHFYKKVFAGTEFPLEYPDQGVLDIQEDDRILFMALNSSWEIDHYAPNRTRASINDSASARALDQLMDDKYKGWLKIAVWHHPVSGPETMKRIGFLEQLVVNEFQICLHGHVHKAKSDYFRYDHGRGLYIIGAGTFGAPPKEQVPGIPLQYNLLKLDPDSGNLTVETRKKEEPDGAWSADARWGDIAHAPEPRYHIKLRKWKNY